MSMSFHCGHPPILRNGDPHDADRNQGLTSSNGPTEAINNLIKRIKRIGFGFRQFRNYRIRALLYAGRPNWDRLATITPR